MRKSGFFARMAFQSIRKNAKYYIPYFLTCIGAAAMFYIILYLNGNRGLQEMHGGAYVESMLMLGAFVIAIFSLLVLSYTNGFLMKRRQKELGLYNILGMEKRHVGMIMLWETVYTALIGIVGGLIVGILLSKLLLLLLCSILHFDVPFGFEISLPGMGFTAVMFCVIFALNLLSNLRRVGMSKPIELLHSGSTAEREPKSKWLLNVIGILTLSGGYAIAIIVKSPLSALALFFVAVVLVIIGTFCLFTSCSIAFLKLLRRNKRYYYQTKHFTSISGMLHRMKRNAAGLASVCILSTMVLVTVSSTLCLYLGSEDSLNSRYPEDISFIYRDPGEGVVEKTLSVIQDTADAQNVTVKDFSVVKSLEVSAYMNDGWRLALDERGVDYVLSDSNIAIVNCITDTYYSARTGKDVSLEPGHALMQLFSSSYSVPSHISLMGVELDTEPVSDIPRDGETSSYVAQLFCLVVNENDLYTLADAASSAAGSDSRPLTARIGFNMDADSETQLAFYDSVAAQVPDAVYDEYIGENGQTQTYTYFSLYSECRAESETEFYAMNGGFFFLGIFLGFLFLMATVLIIYYKQISEGYEDAERFRIMQQVGMSRGEVQQSIRSQILTVFFLPLAMAGIHIVFAFQMITKLLAIFSLYNVGLFALCCVGTYLLFALIYAIIYLVTAKAYYRIVKM